MHYFISNFNSYVFFEIVDLTKFLLKTPLKLKSTSAFENPYDKDGARIDFLELRPTFLIVFLNSNFVRSIFPF